MSLDIFLQRLKQVRRTGPGQYMARCPAHKDRTPSLSVSIKGDGKILVHCHAACSTADVMAAMGLSLSDLFPESPKSHYTGKMPDWKRRKLEAVRDNELMVLMLADADRKNGKVISLEDKKRERLAKRRLERISEVLDHG